MQSATVLRGIGRNILPELVKANVVTFPDPMTFLNALPKVYTSANRGTAIGQWEVQDVLDKSAVLVNSTMHNCSLEEGILMGGIEAFGGKFPKIKQSKCIKNGDDKCIFEITWK